MCHYDLFRSIELCHIPSKINKILTIKCDFYGTVTVVYSLPFLIRPSFYLISRPNYELIEPKYLCSYTS